ncbi:MAG: serine hydrolase domain-containing protein, partial [Bacteroidota bacterium]
MRYLALYGFLGLFFLSCSQVNPLEKRNTRFSHELEQLQSYFSIPGLSAVITKDGHIVYENYLGYSNIEHGTKVDSLTAFPIASITKLFSATLTMKLVEQNRLSLNDPVQSYGSDFSFGDSILVKHILSHTSQGAVGTSFLYSSRFGYLTPIIEQASGTTFKDAVENEILKPLNLDHTFLLKDSTQLTRQSVNLAST